MIREKNNHIRQSIHKNPHSSTLNYDDYLIINIDQNGYIQFRGSHENVERFLRSCAKSGIIMHLDYLSPCG